MSQWKTTPSVVSDAVLETEADVCAAAEVVLSLRVVSEMLEAEESDVLDVDVPGVATVFSPVEVTSAGGAEEPSSAAGHAEVSVR